MTLLRAGSGTSETRLIRIRRMTARHSLASYFLWPPLRLIEGISYIRGVMAYEVAKFMMGR